MKRSLDTSPDLFISDSSSESSSSAPSWESRSRSRSSSSSSSSSSTAFSLKDDRDVNDADGGEGAKKASSSSYFSTLSNSFKISEAQREIFKDLERERIQERNNGIEFVIKNSDKKNFLNIKNKNEKVSNRLNKKIKFDSGYFSSSNTAYYSPSSSCDRRREAKKSTQTKKKTMTTTFTPSKKKYIDLTRCWVLNENEEIILKSKNRNVLSNDIYEPNESLPDLKIKDVCYIDCPPLIINSLPTPSPPPSPSPPPRPPPPPSSCSCSSSRSSSSLIPRRIITSAHINNSNEVAAETTAIEADVAATANNIAPKNIFPASAPNNDDTAIAATTTETTSPAASPDTLTLSSNSISYIFNTTASREDRKTIENIIEEIKEAPLRNILLEKFNPYIKLLLPYSREITTIFNTYQNNKKSRDKYMNATQCNSDSFIDSVIKKCIAIIKECQKIKDDSGRLKITSTALEIFHLKMCKSIKRLKRIRIPDIQLDWCIHAAVLRLNAFAIVTVKELNFDTNFCHFVGSLGDQDLLSKLNNINNATFLIFKYIQLVGFDPRQMSRAVDLYKLISRKNTLDQKTPKNLALAVLCYIDPRIKPAAAKFCNLKTIQSICSHIRNYLRCIGSYDRCFLNFCIRDNYRWSSPPSPPPPPPRQQELEQEREEEQREQQQQQQQRQQQQEQQQQQQRQQQQEQQHQQQQRQKYLYAIWAKYHLLKRGLKNVAFKNVYDVTCYTDIDLLIHEIREMEKNHQKFNNAVSNNPKLRALFDPVDLKFLPSRTLIPDFGKTGRGGSEKKQQHSSCEVVTYHF
nr:MAG: wsv282-like protein [Porcellio scaber clopovirus]